MAKYWRLASLTHCVVVVVVVVVVAVTVVIRLQNPQHIHVVFSVFIYCSGPVSFYRQGDHGFYNFGSGVPGVAVGAAVITPVWCLFTHDCTLWPLAAESSCCDKLEACKYNCKCFL